VYLYPDFKTGFAFSVFHTSADLFVCLSVYLFMYFLPHCQQIYSSASVVISILQAILRDSVVSVEIEVKPHNLVPDTNCFIDYLTELQIIARAGPAPHHYYTLMVPMVGEWHVYSLSSAQGTS
jgi:hypothetical protein